MGTTPNAFIWQGFQGSSQEDWQEHCKARPSVKTAQLSCTSLASPRAKLSLDSSKPPEKPRTPFRNTINKSFKESAAKLDMVLEPTSARSSNHSHAENDSLRSNVKQDPIEALSSDQNSVKQAAGTDKAQQLLEEHLALDKIEKLAKDRSSSVSLQFLQF